MTVEHVPVCRATLALMSSFVNRETATPITKSRLGAIRGSSCDVGRVSFVIGTVRSGEVKLPPGDLVLRVVLLHELMSVPASPRLRVKQASLITGSSETLLPSIHEGRGCFPQEDPFTRRGDDIVSSTVAAAG